MLILYVEVPRPMLLRPTSGILPPVMGAFLGFRMRTLLKFIILIVAFSMLVIVRSYNAHIEQQQQEKEKKSLREKVRERECKLMFPTQEHYYNQCLRGKRRNT